MIKSYEQIDEMVELVFLSQNVNFTGWECGQVPVNEENNIIAIVYNEDTEQEVTINFIDGITTFEFYNEDLDEDINMFESANLLDAINGVKKEDNKLSFNGSIGGIIVQKMIDSQPILQNIQVAKMESTIKFYKKHKNPNIQYSSVEQSVEVEEMEVAKTCKRIITNGGTINKII